MDGGLSQREWVHHLVKGKCRAVLVFYPCASCQSVVALAFRLYRYGLETKGQTRIALVVGFNVSRFNVEKLMFSG